MAYFKSEWKFSGSTSSEPASVTLWTATMLASLRKARESTRMVRSGGAPSLSRELPSNCVAEVTSAYSKPCCHFWPRPFRRLGASRAAGNALMVLVCRSANLSSYVRVAAALQVAPDVRIRPCNPAITRGAAHDANEASVCNLNQNICSD